MRLPRLPRLNCWIVAMWLWLAGRGRGYAFVRRSLHLYGLIPHFGHAEHDGMRGLTIREYVPKRGRSIGIDNIVVVFNGEYRVWHLRVQSVRRHATLAQALADHGPAAMTDICDLASEREEEARSDALAEQQRRAGLAGKTVNDSALLCRVCDDPIPTARRAALPGVQTCVLCQANQQTRELS